MPKRVVDGEALWNSSKLLRVRNFAWQDRYARLIPLAMANGTFEADPYRIHQQAFGLHRSDVTAQDVAAMLRNLSASGCCFAGRPGAERGAAGRAMRNPAGCRGRAGSGRTARRWAKRRLRPSTKHIWRSMRSRRTRRRGISSSAKRRIRTVYDT